MCRIVRLAKEQLAPDANVQHPNMLTGPTASRGLRKPAPPSDRHLEKEQPRRGRHAAAKAGAFWVHLRFELFIFQPSRNGRWGRQQKREQPQHVRHAATKACVVSRGPSSSKHAPCHEC
jgi:hypothetical protein